MQQVGQFAGELHATGAGPHNRQALQGALLLLEPLHELLQAIHIRQAAEAEAVLLHTGDAVAGGLTAGGDHQFAVVQLAPGFGGELLGGGVDLAHALLQPHHAFAGQQLAVARSDLPAPQLLAEQLIEQGQKQEPLLWFDQQYRCVGGCSRQLQGGAQSAETASDHHNRLLFGLGWRHWFRSGGWCCANPNQQLRARK